MALFPRPCKRNQKFADFKVIYRLRIPGKVAVMKPDYKDMTSREALRSLECRDPDTGLAGIVFPFFGLWLDRLFPSFKFGVNGFHVVRR